MPYFTLTAGIILIIYALITVNRQDAKTQVGEDSSSDFNEVLYSQVVLQRLDEIEGKTISIENEIKKAEDLPSQGMEDIDKEEKDTYVEEDLNARIFKMNDQGMDVEEIAKALGLFKGEILLRLGMRK